MFLKRGRGWGGPGQKDWIEVKGWNRWKTSGDGRGAMKSKENSLAWAVGCKSMPSCIEYCKFLAGTPSSREAKKTR